jgi:hypothetical protein
MVFSTKLGITFSTKAFFNGKTICGDNLNDNLWNQIDSIDFIGKSPLTTNNIKYSKKPTCVGSSFLNLFFVRKNRNIIDGDTCGLFLLAYQSSGAFAKTMVKSFASFLIKAKWLASTYFFMVGMPLVLWYVINLVLHLVCMAKISRPRKST